MRKRTRQRKSSRMVFLCAIGGAIVEINQNVEKILQK